MSRESEDIERPWPLFQRAARSGEVALEDEFAQCAEPKTEVANGKTGLGCGRVQTVLRTRYGESVRKPAMAVMQANLNDDLKEGVLMFGWMFARRERMRRPIGIAKKKPAVGLERVERPRKRPMRMVVR